MILRGEIERHNISEKEIKNEMENKKGFWDKSCGTGTLCHFNMNWYVFDYFFTAFSIALIYAQIFISINNSFYALKAKKRQLK